MSTKNKRIICMILMLAIVIQALLPIRVYAHTANGHYTTAQVPGKWIKSGTYWYWQKTNGTNLTSAFLDYDGSTYYLAANGVMGVG